MKKFRALALFLAILTASPAWAAITFTANSVKGPYSIGGKSKMVTATLALSGTYITNGFSVTPSQFGLSEIEQVIVQPKAGYVFFWDRANKKVIAYQGAGFTPAGTNSTSAVTGTGTFAGTAPTAALNIASPVFSGTGQSSAGQVITTTDNQTMTLNQCAGMWFVSATHGPYLIASNTAVNAAPAVLTIVGTAPTTDAGAYQILKALTPAGTVSALSGTAAAQTFAGTPVSAAGLSQVANATNLAAVDEVNVIVIGF